MTGAAPTSPRGACTVLVLGSDGPSLSAIVTALAGMPSRAGQDGFRVIPLPGPVFQTSSAALPPPFAEYPPPLCLLLAPDDSTPAGSAQATLDADLRAGLARHGLPFQVIHGVDVPERLRNAERAVSRRSSLSGNAERRPWVWSCEKCSDPACEHQLFRRLVSAHTRPDAPTGEAH